MPFLDPPQIGERVHLISESVKVADTVCPALSGPVSRRGQHVALSSLTHVFLATALFDLLLLLLLSHLSRVHLCATP